jgi:hypothetical protein
VKQRFDDNISWLELGTNPDLIGKLDGLYRTLSGETLSATEADAAATAIRQLVGAKWDCLMVIDDAWDVGSLPTCLLAGSRSWGHAFELL